MKRHIFSALAAVAALALASCSMFNDVEKPAESTGAYLKIGATAARTALPSVENVTDFTSFTLTGTASGEAASVNTSWTGDDSATAYAKMTAASVAVTKDATYAFTLSAVKGGATWSGTATKTIAAGANSLSFTLSLSSPGLPGLKVKA